MYIPAKVPSQAVFAIRTSQGAFFSTSDAIEPSTREAPWTRRFPTTMIRAPSRRASSHITFAGSPSTALRLILS